MTLNINITFFLTKFITLTLLLTLYACQEPSEGCTAPLASNYDATADEDCTCCTFYQLQLNTDQIIEDSTLFLNKNYVDANNDSFQITFLGLYIYNPGLINEYGERQYTESSYEALTNFDTYTLISSNTFTYDLGKFTLFGNYDSLFFKIGNQYLENQTPTTLVDYSALTDDRLFYNNKYQALKLSIYLEDTEEQKDFFITDLEQAFQIESPINVVDGNHTSINLKLDYTSLLQNISFRLDDSLTISQQLTSNLASFIEIN